MQIKDIIAHLSSIAPPCLQESYDNAGLITGDPNMEFKGSLSCLDSTEAVIDEAIAKGVNLVVAHHPIVFKGLKRFNGKNYVERVIIKAIKHDIAIYAIHTNLDNVRGGVNDRIADQLGLNPEGREILIPKGGTLSKLETYIPSAQLSEVHEALWNAGAGSMGNYDQCSFNTAGKGTFRPLPGADPHVGKVGAQQEEYETKLEMIFPSYLKNSIVNTLIRAHLYEQPAYQIITLENNHQDVGAGIIGNLNQSQSTDVFLKKIKQAMGAGALKHTNICHKEVIKVAVIGGSGVFGLQSAIAGGAQVFVTSDVKYHEFFDAENKIILVDIGHYESEQHTQQLLQEILVEKFPKFAHLLTGVNTNPVNYL